MHRKLILIKIIFTSLHSNAYDPSGSHSHGLHPVLLLKFQCIGAQRSHDIPTTLGRQGHWPVWLSQWPLASAVPIELQTHSVKRIL